MNIKFLVLVYIMSSVHCDLTTEDTHNRSTTIIPSTPTSHPTQHTTTPHPHINDDIKPMPNGQYPIIVCSCIGRQRRTNKSTQVTANWITFYAVAALIVHKVNYVLALTNIYAPIYRYIWQSKFILFSDFEQGQISTINRMVE